MGSIYLCFMVSAQHDVHSEQSVKGQRKICTSLRLHTAQTVLCTSLYLGYLLIMSSYISPPTPAQCQNAKSYMQRKCPIMHNVPSDHYISAAEEAAADQVGCTNLVKQMTSEVDCSSLASRHSVQEAPSWLS